MAVGTLLYSVNSKIPIAIHKAQGNHTCRVLLLHMDTLTANMNRLRHSMAAVMQHHYYCTAHDYIAIGDSYTVMW